MSTQLDHAVELLDRSLGYTRVALAGVRPTLLTRPTPCARWDLGALLAHMDDALEAFLEAARGEVAVEPLPPSGDPVTALRDKACALLGAWARAARTAGPEIGVGGAPLLAPLLVATAALEVTVHGWDVAQALRLDHPVPGDLAEALLPVADLAVAPADRGVRFAAPAAAPAHAPADVHLLAALGRRVPVRA